MFELIQAERVLETTPDALQYCLKFTNKYSLVFSTVIIQSVVQYVNS